jgi:hypothetical protein
MAKVPVILKIEDFKSQPEREVHEFRMAFNQATDAEGQVTSIVRGGKITMRLKALNEANIELISWMTDQEKTVSGEIKFMNTTNNKPLKTVNFKDAYCVSYLENWEDTPEDVKLAHWEEITISCREIQIDTRPIHENTWDKLVEKGSTRLSKIFIFKL